MTRSILLVAASGLAVCVAGCSALGLDRFDFPDCGSEGGCNALNERDSIPWDRDTEQPTRCLAWRCDQSSGACRYGAPDSDQDGHYSSVLCGSVDGVEPADDCDDEDPTVVPGATEACNGRDDDCSGIADDVFTELGAPIDVMPIRGSMSPRWVRTTPLAPTGIAVSWDDSVAAGFAQITTTGTQTAPGAALSPFAQSTAAQAWDAFGRDAELPIERGCPSGSFSRSPARVTCTIDADCGDPSEVCVQEEGGTRMFCEEALSYPSGYPTDGSVCLNHADCGDTVFCNGDRTCQPAPGAVDARQCRAEISPACPVPSARCDEERLGCVQRSTGGCEAESVSFTPGTDGHWLAAFVSPTGCEEGALRLGYFLDEDRADPVRFPNRNILQRGDEHRSTAYLGVDVGDTGGDSGCTGQSRAAGSPIGASGVVTASLAPAGDRRLPQALVAFFAAPLCRESRGGCGATPLPGGTGPVDVEVIGAWLETGRTGASAAPIAWVNATGDGLPARLGASALGAGPALASYEGGARGGYVLAYAQDDGIAVHLIERFADPSPTCGSGVPTPCINTDGTTNFGTDREATPARTTAPLTVPPAVALFDDAAPTGAVAMALGASDLDGRIAIGFAWPETDQVAMAVASLDPGTGAITPTGAITRYDVTDLVAGSLSIAYAATGIGATAEGDAVDGFVAAWSTPSATWAARVGPGGAPIAPGRVRLGDDTAFPRAFVEHVEERDADGDLIRERDVVRVLGSRPGMFVAFRGVCGTEM